MIILTQVERDKFRSWLLQEAAVDNLVSEQLEKLLPPLAKKKRGEAIAKVIVAHILESIEEQEVGPCPTASYESL